MSIDPKGRVPNGHVRSRQLAPSRSARFPRPESATGHGSRGNRDTSARRRQDTAKAHGEALGEKEIELTKQAYGWTYPDPFHVPDEALTHWRGQCLRGAAEQETWRRSLIAYSRGEISILDGSGLEAAACECYRVVRNAPDRPSDDRWDHGEPAGRNGGPARR